MAFVKGITLCITLPLFAFCWGCGGPKTNNDIIINGSNSTVDAYVVEESTVSKHRNTGPSCYDESSATEVSTTNTHQLVESNMGKRSHIRIYVENSGSMYGYVGAGDGSDFRKTVFNYLTDIKISNLFDSLSLYFVNSMVIPKGSSVDDFVDKLKPTVFEVAGGNGGATDIVEIIKKVYPKDGQISVLISDCIISPGKGHNASEYLVNQQTGIKGFLALNKYLPNTGVVIYRMLGSFNEYYYDTVDNKKRYTGTRPYYIWVMGDIQHLKKMRNVTEPKMKTKPAQMCVITMGDPKLKYNIVPAGGKYQISQTDKFTVERLKKMRTAQGERAIIKLNADFSKMLQDESFLTDVSNYEVSDKRFRVDNVIKENDNKFTITISTNQVIGRGTTIYVRLMNKLPQWVNKCSDKDGGFPDPSAKLQTTYGLSYLIGGVYDAYTFNGDNLAEMKITIK